MINKKDVIRMKVPYPSISDDMALASHMYICRKQLGNDYEYVKCQTLKPYMLINNPMIHYHDEKPDLTRNPFTRVTRIDCDKLFSTCTVTFDDHMKTTNRPDVCDDLFNKMEIELLADGYQNIKVDEVNLKILNSMVH